MLIMFMIPLEKHHLKCGVGGYTEESQNMGRDRVDLRLFRGHKSMVQIPCLAVAVVNQPTETELFDGF